MLIYRCSPSSHRVKDVLSLRDPLQIFQVVVVSVPILVVDHKPLVITEKRLSDKPVDVSDGSIAPIVAEGHAQIPLFCWLQQPRASGTEQPLYPALSAHDVTALKTGHW